MADRVYLTKEEAISVLPEGEAVHCFTPSLIGADWSRKSVMEYIAIADRCEIGGDMSRIIGHGLVVQGDRGALFFEADEEKLAKLERRLSE